MAYFNGDAHGATDGLTNGASAARTDEIKDTPVENFRPIKVVVIGAGYSGIYQAIRIPQRIRNAALTVYEKNDGLGGTWWENRYPGAACDIPAHSYQYSFNPNPDWSTFYAPAPEIQAYLAGTARKFSADRFVKLGHKVTRCEWNQDKGKWAITVEKVATGEVIHDESDVVISARGMLNTIAWPEIKGLKSFKGPVMHSAAWDQSYDFRNKRIGIIGSGSSAIQIVPSLQRVEGAQLSCFVRGKTWISPAFGDTAMDALGLPGHEWSEEHRKYFTSDPERFLKFRKVVEADGNSVHASSHRDSELQGILRAKVTEILQTRLAKKPEIAAQLLPSFAVGCRRLTPGQGYLEALVEDNVDFISTGIASIDETGVHLSDGRHVALDVLVCATGFHTTAPPPFPVVGLDGLTMAARFTPHPETYLSLAVDGFPNYFLMLGPNSAIGSGSLTKIIEAAGDYIVRCVRKLQKEDLRSMVVKRARVADFSAYVDAYFPRTVYMDECRSWYRSEDRAGTGGTRIVGLWPGSTLHAIETLRSPRWEDFEYTPLDDGGGRPNMLRWLGNGWSDIQLTGGDVAWYLDEEYLDMPAAPLPEKSPQYRVVSFSH